MELNHDNAKSDPVDYFPADCFQENGEDMETDPPIKCLQTVLHMENRRNIK